MFKKNTATLVWHAQQTYSARMEAQKAQILAYFDQPSAAGDIYAEKAVFALAQNVHVSEALRQIERTAQWFELPHPTGRDPRGESTFAALGLVSALYRAGDRLTAGVRAAKIIFFFSTILKACMNQKITACYIIRRCIWRRNFIKTSILPGRANWGAI